LHRSDFADEGGIVAVQIAGSDPEQMADAARYNVGLGAQVIDINMGCPAKKVCNVQAGSALMQDEPLVAAILEAVVKAAGVPVTLKTRLGWHDDHQNLPAIAKIAEDCGIAALAVHGRARTQMYKGEARYELIAETKSRLNIPVWVNGDITSPQKAAAVLKQTAADGIMIGRGAQGRPWFFRDLKHYAEHGVLPPALSLAECRAAILNHIRAMHAFYGETVGVRIARKHIGWYIGEMPDGEQARREINRLDNAAAQYDTLAGYLERLAGKTDRWACGYREG
ncbi:TPA: tRNA dihydrouridine synthase DusB, partial [Neisseria gonorrhoeae]